jgi:hypothetical protein
MMSVRLFVFILTATALNAQITGLASAAPFVDGIWDPIFERGLGHPLPEDVELTPAGKAAYESFSLESDPTLKCIMPGVPLGIYDPYPLEIIQQDHQIVFLYEHFHMVRRFFIDGREPPADWWPSLVGFSVGNWEGNTLVVKTTHLSPENVMWHSGMPFSGDSESYVIERYNFDGDEMNLTAEVFDPSYYEKPYVIRSRRMRMADGVIFEYECYADFNGAELTSGD